MKQICVHCGRSVKKQYTFRFQYHNGEGQYNLCEICYPTLLRIVETYARLGFPKEAFDYEMRPKMSDPKRYGAE